MVYKITKREGIIVDYLYNGCWKHTGFILQPCSVKSSESFDPDKALLSIAVSLDKNNELSLDNVPHFLRIANYDGTIDELMEVASGKDSDTIRGKLIKYCIFNQSLEDMFLRQCDGNQRGREWMGLDE